LQIGGLIAIGLAAALAFMPSDRDYGTDLGPFGGFAFAIGCAGRWLEGASH